MREIFKENGTLHRHLPKYNVRENQIALAESVEEAIVDSGVLVAEAGTGIGKTWGYLVPSLKSGKKTIVSTYTKVLQNQIFEKDLPLLRQVLNTNAKMALLKGRDNYLCLERFGQAEVDFWHQKLHQKIAQILEEKTFFSGEYADFPKMPLDFWKKINVQAETCLREKCPHFEDCYFFKARKKAEESDVLVVNHHLFFSYLSKTSIFKNAEVIIFDEAHHVPDVAAQFFSYVVDFAKLIHLLSLLQSMHQLPQYKEWNKEITKITLIVESLSQNLPQNNSNKLAWAECAAHPKFEPLCQDLAQKTRQFVEKLPQNQDELNALPAPIKQQYDNVYSALLEQTEAAQIFLEHKENRVRFVSRVKNNSVSLVNMPLEIGNLFQKQFLNEEKAFVLTSATLSVGGNFSHFCALLNLQGQAQCSFASPFAYEQNARLYVPFLSSSPNEEGHSREVLRAAWRLMLRSPGGIFILSTTNKSCDEMHAILESVMEKYPQFLLLKQHQAAPSELLKRFQEHGKAILVATRTFWEGVDVPGSALSLVIIDKLPFAALGDPVVRAKMDYLNNQAKSAFMNYQLPQAAMILKQGAGRLIRSESDYGILMIGDNRFLSKNYRDFILKSLPPMPLIQTELEAVRFLENHPFKQLKEKEEEKK